MEQAWRLRELGLSYNDLGKLDLAGESCARRWRSTGSEIAWGNRNDGRLSRGRYWLRLGGEKRPPGGPRWIGRGRGPGRVGSSQYYPTGNEWMSKIRQAVVIVHGMGEQRPLDTLNTFIKAGLAPDATGQQAFYSRPDEVTDSYEARRYLAPPKDQNGVELHAQTEFYEYHWAHLMQSNRLSDMWPTFRKMLLRLPNRVPSGLRGVWALFWTFIGVIAWGFAWGPLSSWWFTELGVAETFQKALGAGLLAVVLTFVVTRILPGFLSRWISTSLVDVVRYLDTRPRSYKVRHDIRKGMVDLLQGLHDSKRYQRIVVVSHSLGAYIAYDGITYLWARMNTKKTTPTSDNPDGLADVEELASSLNEGATEDVGDFQAAQRRLWLGIRAQGNPWLITDFISMGTPMYFADVLYTKNREEFWQRVQKTELPTCPPQSQPTVEGTNVATTQPRYSYVYFDDRSLYHGAPFAVVRWTNMWFPTRALFFGDWFGGPLTPLFGRGIRDIELTGNKRKRLRPAAAHTLYFKFPDDTKHDSVTTHLRNTLDLASSSWLPEPSKDQVLTETIERSVAQIDERLERMEDQLKSR
jgi:hypothetical protein